MRPKGNRVFDVFSNQIMRNRLRCLICRSALKYFARLRTERAYLQVADTLLQEWLFVNGNISYLLELRILPSKLTRELSRNSLTLVEELFGLLPDDAVRP